ncbi:MAG: hypothetical protein NVS3B20_09590 [Polyangiales bacterium]
MGVATQGTLAQKFVNSAARNGVPADLLIALARVEGGLELPAVREIDPDAHAPAAGPMQLRRGKLDTLAMGARLMGVSELALRRDADLALEAGARVLASLGAETSAVATDVTTWRDAIEQLSGYADALHRRDYSQRVFRVLADGGALPARDGEIIKLDRSTLPPHFYQTMAHPSAPPGVVADTPFGVSEFPGAEWFPTNCSAKCSTTRGASILYVGVHDTEGGWDASVATLQNDPDKSVHYIVGTDGRVGQFIPEAYNGWHLGNSFYNRRTIGIEHVGYHNKPYPEAEYAESAKLVAYLTDKYGIPKDRAHIFGHEQVPNGTLIGEASAICTDSPASCDGNVSYGGAGHHTDPGVWEWCTYMARFGGSCKCNDASELWKCSHDKTDIFRCSASTVEVRACSGGCIAQSLDGNDQCIGAEDGANGAETTTNITIATDDSGVETPAAEAGNATTLPAPSDPDLASGCGCRTPASRPSETSPSLYLLAMAITAFTRRRQNRPAPTSRNRGDGASPRK